MEEYSYDLWGETYNYDHVPTSVIEDINGLHAEIDTHHGPTFVNEKNDYIFGGFNDILTMKRISTPGKVFIDDFTNSSNDDYDIMFLVLDETKAPSQPSNICPSQSVNPNVPIGFFDGVEDEFAQLIGNKDTSNSTLKNPSPVFLDGFSYPDQTKALITENAQGLPKPSPKRTGKPSEPKDKSWTNKEMKVVSAAELESDQWVWKKYANKQLKGIGRQRSYYRCEIAGLKYGKCEAKRHVNESCTDPNAYDVTYIGHHNHSHPTHSSYPIRKRTRYVKIKKEEEYWSN